MKAYYSKINPIDPKDPMKMRTEGTFERSIRVGSKERRILIYIPKGCRPSCAGVFVLGKNGETADDLLRNSPWRELADRDESREKFVVYFLEPEDGVWHTEEEYGLSDGDVAYVDAVYAAALERIITCIHESKYYLFGCGEGGTIAHMEAMYHPAAWAGVCSAGGADVSKQYLEAAGTDCCKDLLGFADEDGSQKIRKSSVAVPAWLIEDPACGRRDSEEVLEYWKNAAGITEDAVSDGEDSWTFVRTKEPRNPVYEEKEAFCVRRSILPGASGNYAAGAAEKAKEFLLSQRRWMGDPCGDLQKTKDPVQDIGMEYFQKEIGGWLREWYVYVPAALKQDPQKKVPMVLAMHGYSCSGEIYACDSGWYKVADKYGFIVVHPSATPGKLEMETIATSADNIELPGWNVMHNAPNGPDENLFFRELIAWMRRNYPVDERRIFVTGHSYGSVMTQILAMTESDLFAAAAPCSGVIFPFDALDIRKLPEVAQRSDGPEVPVWMFVGEKEPWLFPHIPENGNITEETIRRWCEIDHTPYEPQAPDSERWVRHGKWNDLHFYNSRGIPMVNYTWIKNFPHATTTEMSFRIWEEFFSKFYKENETVNLTQ